MRHDWFEDLALLLLILALFAAVIWKIAHNVGWLG